VVGTDACCKWTSRTRLDYVADEGNDVADDVDDLADDVGEARMTCSGQRGAEHGKHHVPWPCPRP